jgi:hypothetical protein
LNTSPRCHSRKPCPGRSTVRARKGWEKSTNSYEADLEFLARVAAKVARVEEDLGTVNAVLADAVQKRMLGEIDDYDVENAAGLNHGFYDTRQGPRYTDRPGSPAGDPGSST